MDDKSLLLDDPFLSKSLSFLKNIKEKELELLKPIIKPEPETTIPESNSIPIPSPDFLRKVPGIEVGKYNPNKGHGKLIKYEKEYFSIDNRTSPP